MRFDPRSARWLRALLLVCCAFPAGLAGADSRVPVRPPSEVYGPLFEAVQMAPVFPDGKTFADAVPKQEPARIVAEYERLRRRPDFDLRAFVERHFDLPRPAGEEYRSDPDGNVCAHIDALWSVLTREPETPPAHSSLLPLPYRYVVPGGRFNEIYYWDSYFTMLGLEESGRHDLAVDMVKNFAWLIEQYGHIPNGNRSYYLSRSQPPFFAAMVELIAGRDGDAVLATYLPALEREYAFWMEGAEELPRGKAHRRVVRLRDGSILNRYWDDRPVPRDEAYRVDTLTARESGRPPPEVYRNLRAAAESGWDFSSRWFEDSRSLRTIRTVQLVPVDLNSLMHRLESTLARAYQAAGRLEDADAMRERAELRKSAIHRHLWNERMGAFTDLLWQSGRLVNQVTAATLYPLYFGIADRWQAELIASRVRTTLLRPHGIATTAIRTGEQWDAPNGWAPLQWIAIAGLNDYGEKELAAHIARIWTEKNISVFRETGKLVEKYDVTGDAPAGGGEYALQDGFGWTNGVLRRLLASGLTSYSCEEPHAAQTQSVTSQ